jgi:glycosyl transferase family 87
VPVSIRLRRGLWLVIGFGLVLRVVLAFETEGIHYDTESLKAVRNALTSDPLHVYSLVNGHPHNRWPYPPGFFPWLAVAGALTSVSGLSFHGWALLPQIAADGALAWLVQDFLGRRGAPEMVRLAASSLVAVGPAFWIVTSFHGHIDSLAILPAVLAVWLWDRSPPGVRRALLCGLLAGLGASLKLVPILVLVALIRWASSRREVVVLVASALVVPALAFAPFLVADWDGTVHTFQAHRALPGFGGIGLLVQPELAKIWLNNGSAEPSGVSRFLLEHQGPIVAVLMVPVVGLVLARRPRPVVGAALLFSALVVLDPGFGFQYVLWALPFALMAGCIWQVAVLEALLFPPAALLYWHPFGHAPTAVYATFMIAAWLFAMWALVRLGGALVTYSPRASSAPRSP